MSNAKRSLLFFLSVTAAAFILWPMTGCAVKDETASVERLRTARHPMVYLTPADVERGRLNAARHPWARAIADGILAVADEWTAKDDAWILAQVPAKGACFAYGLTGCPICGAGFGGYWDKARASFDNPGHVTCDNGHVLPDAAHPDPGTGWVARDGRTHYFIGAYNSWVIEKLTLAAAENLAYAYSLTGDERYAAKAGLILDAVADIYPSCDKGSWDYPSTPPSGRLDRPWYQVSRVLVRLIDAYDQIYHCPSLDGPSLTAGLSRRANIETSMLRNGAAYCFEHSQGGTLNNGEADYVRGVLAAGILLDIPEYILWAVDGPYGIYSLLENNVSRDGQYYESSPLYSDHARNLYVTFAEPLRNCRREPYPDGLDLYAHPKMKAVLTLLNLSIVGAGHLPPYGDTAPDMTRLEAPSRPENSSDLIAAARLYERTPGGPEKLRAASLRAHLAETPEGRPQGEAGDPKWLLFHQTELPAVVPPLPAELRRRIDGSHFLGQEGLGMLRAGERGETALLLRFGPSLNHSHLDDLGYNLFGLGYELTYDLGYQLANTHTQVGFARQTTSHNLVVVDESPQHGLTGGSLHLFADFPEVKVIEASSENSYAEKGVSLYRRTMALVGDGPGAYLVDLFRVRGGRRHDLFTHFRGTRGDLAGAQLGREERGSLAGPGFDWGNRQLNDGDMEGHPNQFYWNPPPGNGYGFLVHPRRGPMTGSLTADWRADEDARVRLILAPEPGTEIVTADAPGIRPYLPRAEYVIARRQGENLASAFASVVEPAGGPARVASVEDLALEEAAGSSLRAGGATTAISDRLAARGLVIGLEDGSRDYIYSALDGAARTAAGLELAGRFIFARVKDGALEALYFIGAHRFQGLGWTVRAETAGWEGAVDRTEPDGRSLLVTGDLPADSRLEGAVITFSNPGYTRTTSYRVAKIVKEGGRSRIFLDETFVLGKGEATEIKGPGALVSRIPHEYARSVHRQESGFFRGKLIRSASGAETRILRATPGKTLDLEVESAAAFRPGEAFRYFDIQEGDTFRIEAVGRLERLASGEYRYAGTAAAVIQAPVGGRIEGDR